MQNAKIARETVVTFAEARRRLPTTPSYTTMQRWAYRGMRDRQGRIVSLEWCRIGGSPCTSMEAFHRWVERRTTDPAANTKSLTPN